MKIWCRRGLSDWTNEIDTIIFNGERESLCGLFGENYKIYLGGMITTQVNPIW